MEHAVVVARLVHILGGVFWVGAVLFVTFLLLPAVRDVGPDGGKVMGALVRRRLLEILPAVALLTILSGLFLYDTLSGHFRGPWMHTPTGIAFGVGGILSIIALVLGVSLMRPATLQAGALTAQAMGLPEGAERAARLAEAERLRGKAGRWGTVVTWLLLVTAALMAVARYL